MTKNANNDGNLASFLLEASCLRKTFKVSQGFFAQPAILHAVNNVSFNLRQGESLGLVGESGCGKSTLGRIACGLMPPSSGSLLFKRQPLPPAGRKSWAAGQIQMIFQDPASSLNPRMTAEAAIAEPLQARGETKTQALHQARELLVRVGLPNLGNRYPHQFSGGQRQRIAIARALITRPDLIICDEPVSALDASVQAQILNLLSDLREQFKPAYLFISHDLAVVGFMCQRIMVMYLGIIVEAASREELFSHAAHPYSRALLAAMPQGEKVWAQQRRELPPPLSGELPSPIHPPSGCAFHPRCSIAKPICTQFEPPWQTLGKDWFARCHFAGQ